MENLIENMSDILQKCIILEEYVSLHLRRQTILPNLKELKSKTDKTEDIVMESNKIFEEHTKSFQQYKQIMNRMRNQQSVMLKLIEIIKERKKEAIIEIHSVKKPSQLSQMTPLAVKLYKNQRNTPQMYFSDYENSPFVPSKIQPMSLQFFDFDARITVEMFNGIPKYMRGRDTLDDLINFLDGSLIPCFVEKYQLINKKRDFIKKTSNELQIWNMYKEQTSLFPNQKFITQADLARKLNRLIDKKIQGKITMLRHLSIISEQRKSSIACYIWTSN